MNGLMNKFYGEYNSAFDVISRKDPAISFETGFKGIDNIIDGKLKLGEIFEICGERHSAKFYIAHVILANVLVGQQNTESFQMFIFDYAHLFNVKLLKKLARKKSSLSDERIDELIGSVFVRNYYELDDLYSSLKELARVVNETRVWQCYDSGISVPVTIVFIMDIGSLLHEASYAGMQGRHAKGEIYRQFETMAKGGAFTLLLNHCSPTDERFPVNAALGKFWHELVRNRVFFVRDERDEKVHIMLAQDGDGQMKRVKFRLNIRPDDIR